MRTFPSAKPARKALEIRWPLQRPVQPRRTDFQDVSRPGNQFLDVEDHAQLLADALAIRVADLRIGVMRNLRRPYLPHCIANHRRWLRYPIDVHPQEPLLADFPFDINDFQAFRTRHPFGSAADFLQIHAETPRP